MPNNSGKAHGPWALPRVMTVLRVYFSIFSCDTRQIHRKEFDMGHFRK
jgi:hypothetical protein